MAGPLLRPPPPYQYQEWPRCYYGPDGQCEEFNSVDEVPEGWVTHPKMLEDGWDAPEPISVDEDAEDEGEDDGEDEGEDEGEDDDAYEAPSASAIAAAYSQDALIDMINAANTGRSDKIEFLGNWSKVRLAQALLDGGVKITLKEDEE